MDKPPPIELRQRFVDHVAEGNTHRSTAARFKVSVRFVNDMVKLMKATGGLVPKAQGNGGGHGKLSSLKNWIARRIAEKRDLTAAGLAREIAATHGMTVHRGSVWGLLRDLGLTHKKRPASRRAEAARGCSRAPHLDHSAPALHGQHADAEWLYLRNLGQAQHGQDHRLGTSRREAGRSRALPFALGPGEHPGYRGVAHDFAQAPLGQHVWSPVLGVLDSIRLKWNIFFRDENFPKG